MFINFITVLMGPIKAFLWEEKPSFICILFKSSVFHITFTLFLVNKAVYRQLLVTKTVERFLVKDLQS